jgi:hypothetical protein
MGLSPANTSNFTLNGKEFQIGPTFSLKMRDVAISFCEKEEREGKECLLIERSTAVTVWTQVKQPKRSSPKLDKQAFIERCNQELTKSIGPMASLIIDELLNGSELLTPSQLIDRIAAEIPNQKLAEEFKRKMKK